MPATPEKSSSLGAPDRSAEIAWTIIKVIINLIRFWFGGLLTLGFVLGLLSAVVGPDHFQRLGGAMISGFLAFIIWPQRYGPPTKLIEAWQKSR